MIITSDTDLMQACQTWLNDLKTSMAQAVDEAIKKDKFLWAYILGILGNWQDSGGPTLANGSGKSGKKVGEIDPDKYIKGKYGHIFQR